jgi:hypothetical protein
LISLKNSGGAIYDDGMATPNDAIDAEKCPRCCGAGRLRSVSTVADQREDLKLTYGCPQCHHEWSVVKPAQWLTRLGEEDENG